MDQAHHIAWLSAHPERSAEWLRDRLADGFHVHHIDGNHENNAPRNLVLIESGDHMMLHNGSSRLLWRPGINKGGGRKRKPTIDELEAQLAPLVEKRERAERKARRLTARDRARAMYARESA